MLTLDFSLRKEQSLTDFLYSQIKDRILSGSLEANSKLPSKRSLASHLGLSVITVQNAYQQLIDEGYVYSQEKRGYFVTQLETAPLPPPINDSPLHNQILLETEKKQVKITTINLRDSHIHPELFPFSRWSSLTRRVLHESKSRILSPLPPEGLWELRQAVSTYLGTFRNMDVVPEQVIIGAGTEYLYSLLLQLLGKNLRYGVENPGYLKPARIMKAMEVEWCSLDMDEGGIIPSQLEEKQLDVVLVSPAHHFPSGIIMPIRRRQELLTWAKKSHGKGEEKKGFIIEDDYDSEFRFTGRPLETLFSLDGGEKVIYLNTFTKTLTPSLRISYMVLPRNLVKPFHKTLGFYSCTVSSIEQLTLARFIQEGHYEKHLTRKKNQYRNLRDKLLLHLTRSPLAKQITITGKDTGLHFLMEVKTSMSPQQLQEQLEKKGIQVAFLSQYFHQQDLQEKTPTLVINYSSLKKEQIPLLVEILTKICTQRRDTS